MIGRSMEPLLASGDKVRVVPAIYQSLNNLPYGTLVLYLDKRSSTPIVHRIVGKGRECLYEKGDRANNVSYVSFRSIVGTVTHRKRDELVTELSIPLGWRVATFLRQLGIR